MSGLVPDRLPIFILTSSTRKFEHLQFLFGLHSVKAIRIPAQYPEIQENDMVALLRFASENLQAQLPFRSAFYLLEQTAVYLNAFGRKPRGPGFYFKQWWESKPQNELKDLFARDPRAALESGMSLLLPNHQPIIFTNTQTGHVSFEGEVLQENKKYSWLSSDDFNFYFVPKGSNKVYNALPMVEFLNYDFRRPNVDKVTERLSEYESLLTARVSLEEIQRFASGQIRVREGEQVKLDPSWKNRS